jgi:hypothetical protein
MLAGTLVVELDDEAADPDTVTQLRDLCATHHGDVPVYVRIRTADQGTFCIRAGRAMYVQPSDQLYAAAQELVGAGRARYLPRNGDGNGGNGNGNGGKRRPRRVEME